MLNPYFPKTTVWRDWNKQIFTLNAEKITINLSNTQMNLKDTFNFYKEKDLNKAVVNHPFHQMISDKHLSS
jgi:hypothetical protein